MGKKKRRQALIIIFIILVYLGNQSQDFSVKANSNYSIGLEKGTQILEVKKYDNETWKNTINANSTPIDWFGGDAEKIRAKSKSTLLDYYGNALSTYPLFFTLVIPQKSISLFSNISQYGYNYTYVFNNYPTLYEIWDYYYNSWNFTTKEFNVNPDALYEKSYIFKFPQTLSTLLLDYNDFAGILNNDTNLQSLGNSFPLLNGDDLVWQFIIRGFSIGNPKNDYLTTFINAVGCKNATINGDTLIFKRYGVKNYTVEVKYGDQGLIEHFLVKNLDGYVFYEITSFYPQTVFYIILGGIGIFILGIVIVIIIKKYKFKKYFNLDQYRRK